MVRGLDTFRKYFEDYKDNYIIIGGTACDIALDEAGLVPRATKDIDIILIVEALNSEFVNQFWKFIIDGQYEHIEDNPEERKYYRFTNPQNTDFPYQIELFSRIPDLIDFPKEARFTPIPVEDALSSLSAILMDDEYYKYTIENCTDQHGLRRANTEALICLKATAFVNMTEMKAKVQQIDSRKINNQKTDIFRLAILMAPADEFILPERIKEDLETFMSLIKDDLPGKDLFKDLGAGNIDPKSVYDQLIKSFQLKL